MISLDMKYTSLYWCLRFVERELDIHVKSYGGYEITIFAEKQYVDYGKVIYCDNSLCSSLNRHKDFVILECVNRLLENGISPDKIRLYNDTNSPDIIVDDIAITCEQWNDYLLLKSQHKSQSLLRVNVLYSSRLVSGLLEFECNINCDSSVFQDDFLGNFGNLKKTNFEQSISPEIEQLPYSDDFDISQGSLNSYIGKMKKIKVPNGVKAIGASAFWNSTSLEEIILPKTLERLGGDAFYCCDKLNLINIPSRVQAMGNNPFAGCPMLSEIQNESPYFILEDGVLYDSKKQNLIHYTIGKNEPFFEIPSGIECLGKHCFFSCNNLEEIIVPSSVVKFENNPFSGCEKLRIKNHSPNYIVENGIIYNRFKTAIIGVLNSTEIDTFSVPESIMTISRNSFWNCKKINKIILSKNIKIIGYNPFAGCKRLVVESQNPMFQVENGLLLNHDKTEIICCTNISAQHLSRIPNSVRSINRSAFSGCTSLRAIDFNQTSIIEKSSFTHCSALREIFIPDTVDYIGEWAFSYCSNLSNVSINRKTIIARNVFNETPAIIELRN